jgi:glycosyltransferase involved in cell wall biosynthesis
LNKLQLSPNGFDPFFFNIRRSRPNGDENKTIVFVGRFSSAEYGIGLLLNAMSYVLEKVPNVKLALVGDELSPLLKRQIEKMGLNQNVKVYPPTDQNNVAEIIAKSSVCIGPLFATQAIPLKVLEYMALGKPVVSGVRSISSDLAINTENCLLVDSKPKDIATAIVELLSNKELAMQIGKNALLSAKKFSWEYIVEDLIDKFYAVLHTRNSSFEV